MRRCVVACGLLLFLLGMPSTPALAGGGGPANGAEGAFVGVAPPPGFTFVSYTLFYSADTFKDDEGDDLAVFDKATIFAEILRFAWISNLKIFGADYGQHFFVPILHTNLDFNVPVGPNFRKHHSDTNVPYFIYAPVLLAWHEFQGKLHFACAVDYFIPLYNQSDGNLAGVGRNFWTFEPAFAVTWLPTEKIELSAKFMYDFHTEQQDYSHPSGLMFDRLPGQEFHCDYNVSYAIIDNFRLGVGGYVYRQVTNDDYDVKGVADPVRTALQGAEDDLSRVWAIGPGMCYQRRNMFFELKSQYEMDAQNISEGFNLWFKCSYVF